MTPKLRKKKQHKQTNSKTKTKKKTRKKGPYPFLRCDDFFFIHINFVCLSK